MSAERKAAGFSRANGRNRNARDSASLSLERVSNLLLYAIPGFLSSLSLERWWASRTHGEVRGYETRDTLASLAMGVGNVLISAFSTLGLIGFPPEQLNTPSHHPVHQRRALARDLVRARSLGEALHYTFAAPGWSFDGSSQTAKELRRALENSHPPAPRRS